MRTEQEERDEYLLRSSIEYPEFVSKITLENLVFQEVIDNAIFSSEGIQLEKVRLGKGEFVKQRDGSTQFVEFENSTVGNQLSVQQELERQRTNEKEEHDGHYCFSLICLESELVKEINHISSLNFETEESHQRKLKPYQSRLNTVRTALLEYDQPESKKKRNTPRGPLVRALVNCLMQKPDLKLNEIRMLIKSAYEHTTELGGIIGVDYCSGSVNSSNFSFKYQSIDGSKVPDNDTNNGSLKTSLTRARKIISDEKTP